jgi:hypothetical protein
MQHRSDRGEDVPEHVDTSITRSMLETGGAEAFRAVLEAQCVSIVIVMRAAQGCYLHASGTHPDGMKIGHFAPPQLPDRQDTARGRLRSLQPERSVGTRFRTGQIQSGLRCSCRSSGNGRGVLGSPLKRKFTTAAHLIRSNPAAFVKAAVGRLDRWVSYRALTAELAPLIFLKAHASESYRMRTCNPFLTSFAKNSETG